MPSYTLEIEAFGVYSTDIPTLEVWEDGVLDSSHNILSTGSSIILTINYPGSLPSSLEFRFNDALPEGGRTIEIRSVKINDKYVNVGNYLSTDSITNGGAAAVVDVPSSSFLFDASEPTAGDFLPATQTFTAANETYRNNTSTPDKFDMLDGRDRAFLGTGDDSVNGGAGDDYLRGNDGNDLLYGGADNDRIFGDDGDDLLYGGTGNDSIYGGNDNDEIHGNDGNDKLHGNDGDDVITGGAGDDVITGGAGTNYLFGDAGNDQILGDSGIDTIDGGDDDDVLYGGGGDDIINGGGGIDIISGDTGDDTLSGDDGNDLIYGKEDNDTIYGGNGSDTLYGGIGNDTIEGGAGNDTIYGDLGGLKIIMEANNLEVTQANSTEWHSINFSGYIQNAVVKMFAEDVTGDPFTIRVRNVTNTGFEFQLDEYEYLDGATALEKISWIAVSSGTHTLSNGSVIQAGYVTATNENPTAVSFGSAFSGTPVVFSQLSSNNEAQAAVVRNFSTSTTGFNVMMHEQEANAVGHATEDIGWIAIESGGSIASGILAGTTGNVVTHNTTSVNFGGSFGGTPVFIADAQTNNGADPGVTVGSGGVTGAGTNVFFDEEGSADAETNHASENVGYLAIEAGAYTTAGVVNGSDVIYGGDGDDILYADLGVDKTVADSAGLFPLAGEILADGAVAYWKLNETAGTVFDNLGTLGAAVDGGSTGSPALGAVALYSTGGVTVDFDGVNDGILIPDNASINTSTLSEKTVELVFNADDVTTRQVLYEEGGGTHGFAIYLDGGNVYVTGEHDGVWVDADIHAAVVTGTTYHVAFVFDQPNNSFEGFLDGVSMGSVTVGSSNFPSHSGDIGIGYAPDGVQFHDGESGGGGFNYDGRISDVAIYTTALTQAQLQDHVDIVQGIVPPAAPIDDILYGGDGFDQFFAGIGRDVFVFEAASAFNDVDQINGFDVGENDAIDISDLLTGYTAGVSDINDFVQLTQVGSDTVISIDANGTVGGSSYIDIVQINDTSSMTVDAMLLNNSIIA